MIRITTLLWVALLVVAGGTVMHVSYQVRRVQQHLSELARSTHQEQDAIRILGAEWDTLNDPHRIDLLSKRYLTLQPTPIQRVVTLEAIPLKPSEEQLAKLNAPTGTSRKAPVTAKAAGPAAKPAPMPPAIVAAAPRAVPLSVMPAAAHVTTGRPAVDSVGLLLARVEQHE